MEGNWLICLLTLQFLKLIGMTIWHMMIAEQRHGFFEKSIDYSDLSTTRNDKSQLDTTIMSQSRYNSTILYNRNNHSHAHSHMGLS